MDLSSELLILIEELDRTHGAPFSLSDPGILDFVTTKAGPQRHFTSRARGALRGVARRLHQNRADADIRIEVPAFEAVVPQAVADMHADGAFVDSACPPKVRRARSSAPASAGLPPSSIFHLLASTDFVVHRHIRTCSIDGLYGNSASRARPPTSAEQ